MKSAALFLIFFAVVFFNHSEAALLPVDQQKQEKAFLSQADVRAVISVVKIEKEFFCGIKSVFRTSCQCTALYQIEEIQTKPTSLVLRIKDQIILNYPCDKIKRMNWVGSFLPWARPEEGGLFLMTVPAVYLSPLSNNRWQLNNDGKIFAPVMKE